VITLLREWPLVRASVLELGDRPGLVLVYLVNAANVSAQLWLFMWAPLHGKALEASLGYFLMPLVMVLIGRVVYRHPMSRWQVSTTALAGIGVAHELWRVGTISWIVLFIALGFPALFVMRRAFRITGQGGAMIELNLVFLFAITLLVRTGFPFEVLTPRITGLVLLIATISATSMLAYYAASRLLPFSLFGLLGYLEPVLLVVVAFVLGESLDSSEVFTYLPIWAAVMLLGIEGIRAFPAVSRRLVKPSIAA
jgi:chloramphenicol-sensitive protein RarD